MESLSRAAFLSRIVLFLDDRREVCQIERERLPRLKGMEPHLLPRLSLICCRRAQDRRKQLFFDKNDLAPCGLCKGSVEDASRSRSPIGKLDPEVVLFLQ
jgi:hypothetical protein